MKKTAAVLISVVVLFAIAALPAAAGWTWCSTDPHVKLPDGKLVQIWVSVHEENVNDAVHLDVVAPEGSELIGGSGRLNVNVTLHATGRDREITAKVDEDFGIMLDAKYHGKMLGAEKFERGSGSVTWEW